MSRKIPLGIAIAAAFIVAAISIAITVSVYTDSYNRMIRDLPQRTQQYAVLSEIDELIRVHYYGETDNDEVLEKIAENPPVLLVLLRLDKSAQLLYGKLAKAGIPCRVLLLSDGEKEKEKNASPLPVPAEKITEEALLAGRWMV